jgi:hypothetical protein
VALWAPAGTGTFDVHGRIAVERAGSMTHFSQRGGEPQSARRMRLLRRVHRLRRQRRWGVEGAQAMCSSASSAGRLAQSVTLFRGPLVVVGPRLTPSLASIVWSCASSRRGKLSSRSCSGLRSEHRAPSEVPEQSMNGLGHIAGQRARGCGSAFSAGCLVQFFRPRPRSASTWWFHSWPR